jgi:hypothetical protein
MDEMCEFCTEHGEGKTLYLQMKNYAEALLFEELSPNQNDVAQPTTRVEWLDRFIEEEVLPATGRVPGPRYEEEDASPSSQESSGAAPSEEEILARCKTMHSGQVLPIEDIEAVINMVSPITRMPCGRRFLTTGKADKLYCFGFGIDRLGILGRYPDAASSLKVLDKEETKSIFRAYDREGLVHSIWTALTAYVAESTEAGCIWDGTSHGDRWTDRLGSAG